MPVDTIVTSVQQGVHLFTKSKGANVGRSIAQHCSQEKHNTLSFQVSQAKLISYSITLTYSSTYLRIALIGRQHSSRIGHMVKFALQQV